VVTFPQVLVVDDNPDVGGVIAAMIRRLGWATIVTTSGPDGLAAFCLNRATLQVVFLDVHMPEMDGPATLKAMRLVDKSIPFYFVTGSVDVYTHDDLMACGAAGVISKPVDMAGLKVVLERVRAQGAMNPASVRLE
jgi:two-component system OmpR family response regulator